MVDNPVVEAMKNYDDFFRALSISGIPRDIVVEIVQLHKRHERENTTPIQAALAIAMVVNRYNEKTVAAWESFRNGKAIVNDNTVSEPFIKSLVATFHAEGRG